MTTYPVPIDKRAAAVVKSTANRTTYAEQRLDSVGSQVNTLLPGAWSPITLAASWANVGGYIPAQAQLLTQTVVLLVANISGGTTTDGTLIGTLPDGMFNAGVSHLVAVTARTGAAAAAAAGTVTTNTVTQGVLVDGTVNLPTTLIPTNDHSLTGVTDLGPSGLQFDNIPAASTGTLNNLNVTSGQHLTSNVTSTAVDYNSPCLVVDTSGGLTIFNLNSNVTQISFTQLMPLIS